MKCEHCGQNEATFYCRSTVNGRTGEVHLCADCAAKLGYTGQMHRAMSSRFFDPFSLLSDFGMTPLRMLTEFPAPVMEDEAPYGTQREEAPQTGLVSDAEQAQLRQKRERNALQSQLRAAIDEERYEDAARLRDELKKLPPLAQ